MLLCYEPTALQDSTWATDKALSVHVVQLNMASHAGAALQPLDLMQLGVLKTEPDGIVHGDN